MAKVWQIFHGLRFSHSKFVRTIIWEVVPCWGLRVRYRILTTVSLWLFYFESQILALLSVSHNLNWRSFDDWYFLWLNVLVIDITLPIAIVLGRDRCHFTFHHFLEPTQPYHNTAQIITSTIFDSLKDQSIHCFPTLFMHRPFLCSTYLWSYGVHYLGLCLFPEDTGWC